MQTEMAGEFAAVAAALYAAHHVGDYWVQTDEQARHKGDAGTFGALNCAQHVATYIATQVLLVSLVCAVTGLELSPAGLLLGLLISGGTHYLADRREHGIMFKLARMINLSAFLKLGVPRNAYVMGWEDPKAGDPGEKLRLDNPSLGTGAWALDQAWHIFWGVFVTALVMVAL